ncbi:hypothetical protein LTS18_014210, partial [Coniosporium uncinatum]
MPRSPKNRPQRASYNPIAKPEPTASAAATAVKLAEGIARDKKLYAACFTFGSAYRTKKIAAYDTYDVIDFLAAHLKRNDPDLWCIDEPASQKAEHEAHDAFLAKHVSTFSNSDVNPSELSFVTIEESHKRAFGPAADGEKVLRSLLRVDLTRMNVRVELDRRLRELSLNSAQLFALGTHVPAMCKKLIIAQRDQALASKRARLLAKHDAAIAEGRHRVDAKNIVKEIKDLDPVRTFKVSVIISLDAVT